MRFFLLFVQMSRGGGSTRQSPASVSVASPGHAIRHCKIKCSLCSVQQLWWGPALAAAAGLGRWFAGDAVLLVCGDAQGLPTGHIGLRAARHPRRTPLQSHRTQDSERCGCLVLTPPLEISTNRQNRTPQTTCPALPQPPVQAPPHLLHTSESKLDLAVPHRTPRAGHSHTARALCAAVAAC